ncbi:hypothetical protein [Sphingomonas baiyangensis]|uniref:Transposase zinc-ribbon domain-containing protein n=1 Tax=Sphingomonas baiyangensis TaxID=2572576 RepID=A0A4U1L2V9_9SPHN|nr:hypothetical protein [Sphingomonas baiyangensis]TKD50814.1 hypothetical protein FBR43_08570 [Sphingomonas baiyangensis]
MGFAHSFRPAEHGYRIAYRLQETNHCPGCGRSHWHVGRMTAECAYCATALPIRTNQTMGEGLFRSMPVRTPATLAA